MQTINEILKQSRIELGLTMLDVAKAVGVSEGTVSRWESGDIANMRRDKIAALAHTLDLSPSVIMGWDSPKIDTGFSLTADEHQLISDYRDLSIQGQEYIKQTMFIAKQTYKKSSDNSVLEESGA